MMSKKSCCSIGGVFALCVARVDLPYDNGSYILGSRSSSSSEESLQMSPGIRAPFEVTLPDEDAAVSTR